MSDVEQPIGYTLFAILALPRPRIAPSERDISQFSAALDALDSVVLRGIYDVTGMRANADLMIWLHGDRPEDLQAALRALRRTEVLASANCEWSAMGVHREAEFNKRHIPAFLRDEAPKGWLCLYPFVRSYEWYLLPEAERSQMLMEHGIAGAKFRNVLANTVSTFALSDYEWLLPLESDDPIDLVDMMRDLRATEARRHVREEVPFYTGRRLTVNELSEVLS